jgi:hypothetical protein
MMMMLAGKKKRNCESTQTLGRRVVGWFYILSVKAGSGADRHRRTKTNVMPFGIIFMSILTIKTYKITLFIATVCIIIIIIKQK